MIEHSLIFEHPLTQILAFPAIAVLSGSLVLDASRNRKWISILPLRFLGRYSYGMYIWHLTVISVAGKFVQSHYPRTFPTSSLFCYALFIAAVLAIAVVVALISWYVIEQPFLGKGTDPIRRR